MSTATVTKEISMQQTAEQWALMSADIERAEDALRRARNDVDRLRAQLSTLSEVLAKRVGPNVSLRVFNVGDGRVVIVEHEKAIRLAEFTTAKHG